MTTNNKVVPHIYTRNCKNNNNVQLTKYNKSHMIKRNLKPKTT